jgi:hypothetical protein
VKWTVLLAWSRTGETRVWSWRTRTWCSTHSGFGGLGLKITLRMTSFAEFGPQNSVVAVLEEPVATRGITMKGASRRSNFVQSAWPSDQKPMSWSISPLVEWIGSM